MPPRELASNFGATVQQLEQLDMLVRMMALRILSSPQESVWDVANRICDRYFLSKPD